MLGASIIQMIKSHECVPPHEQVAFIRQRQAKQQVFLIMSVCFKILLGILTQTNLTSKVREVWDRKCSFMRAHCH